MVKYTLTISLGIIYCGRKTWTQVAIIRTTSAVTEIGTHASKSKESLLKIFRMVLEHQVNSLFSLFYYFLFHVPVFNVFQGKVL